MIDLESDIEELAKLLGIDKKEAKKKALEEGVKKLKLEKAIELYVNHEISVKQTARTAGISLADWFTVAKEKGLLVQITPDEINEELKTLE